MGLGKRISSLFESRARDWELKAGFETVPTHPRLNQFLSGDAADCDITVVFPPCKNPLIAGFDAFGALGDDNNVGYELSKDFVTQSGPYIALQADMKAKGIDLEVKETEAPCFGRFRYAASVDIRFIRTHG